MSKILISIALCFMFLYNSTYAATNDITNITIKSPKLIEAEFENNPNLKIGELDSDIKVLKDISVSGISEEESTISTILFENPLEVETSYSLLTLNGAEGSIDFSLENTFPQTIENTDPESEIEKIVISSLSSMEVYHTSTEIASSIDYKLLVEHKVVKVYTKEETQTKLFIQLETSLTSGNQYILMFIDLKDINDEQIEFVTGIYDFDSGSKKEETVVDGSVEDDTQSSGEENEEESGNLAENSSNIDEVIEEVEEEQSLDVIIPTEEVEPDVDLNAAEEQGLMKDKDESASNNSISDTDTLEDINTVAGSAEITPETGAEIWLLVIISLFINTFYYFSKQNRLQRI